MWVIKLWMWNSQNTVYLPSRGSRNISFIYLNLTDFFFLKYLRVMVGWQLVANLNFYTPIGLEYIHIMKITNIFQFILYLNPCLHI